MSPDRRDAPRVTAVLKSVRDIHGEQRPWLVVAGFVLVAVIGVADGLSDWRISFAAIYLIPVALVAWFGGRKPGLIAGGASVVVWMLAHAGAGAAALGAFALAWNAVVRLALYLVAAVTLVALRKTLKALADALEREHELARIDPLTGVRNARAFREAAEQEVARSARYKRPLTLAYLDADGFKAVNDRLGHSAGDRVLRVMAQTLAGNVRIVDTVARFGGDEFAILLPETGAEGALAVLSHLRTALAFAMEKEGVDVTFCIGAITSLAAARTVDALLQRADALMYEVKHDGKNGIRADVFDVTAAAGTAPEAPR